MRLKKLHLKLLGLSIVVCNAANAQLFIDQATFTIQAGATVTVQGDVTSNADIQGTGKVILKGTTNQNVNMGGFNVPNVEIDNTANVTLTGNAKVSGDILFTNGKIIAGNNNLIVGSAGTITGATNAKYVVTNGTGKLAKTALGATAFTYPIGKSAASYTPVTVSNSGTADEIGARAIDKVLAAGTTGAAATKEVVDNSWELTEAVAGGSNLSLTTTWSQADELTNFDRTRGGISYYIPTAGATQGWDLLNSGTSAAMGANPYTYTRTGVMSLGVFAVGTRPVLSPLLVSPKIFLQGAYNTSSMVMTDALRNANLIPLTEPYSAITGYLSSSNATRGSGGGETALNTVIGLAAGTSTNNTIVDWVLVQLHNPAGTVVTQRAVLVQRDGDLVETDGLSPVNLAGNAAGSYFISIKHRNHLGVRSASTLALSKVSSINYDFTSALTQALSPVLTNSNNPMATLGTNVYGLWGGNAIPNSTSQKTGGLGVNDYLRFTAAFNAVAAPGPTGVYRPEDFNMDGNIRKTGTIGSGLNDYLRFTSFFPGVITVINQSVF